ncbi:hypothetical protein AVEN_81485-1 [Araneus ventricosus]|uniref:Uncharacterized protein n=1 Tax=Araneus ventricosus TaxID=182803 RepID=A0A4Y2E0S3_ARAVE|nr:hypothetical protein AVEN_81485-1 [Araneus ventricosus]
MKHLGFAKGGGLTTFDESSKSSDILYSNVSPSDAEEELISASPSDFRHCTNIFSADGRTGIVWVAQATKGGS